MNREAHLILDRWRQAHHDLLVIEGGAPGLDWIAAQWADETSSGHERFPADWDRHGKAVGPIRNQQMLDEGKPDAVLAFARGLELSRGTGDMVRRAKRAQVPVTVVATL